MRQSYIRPEPVVKTFSFSLETLTEEILLRIFGMLDVRFSLFRKQSTISRT
jgi:hypothetical protein